jgi:serine protease Do
MEGGPAEKGGLQAGDIIVRFDGSDILRSADLPHVVGLIPPGTRVKVDIVRNHKQMTLRMAVGGLGADEEPSLAARDADDDRGGRVGLVVEEINEQLQSRWGISGGVGVAQVLAGSAAEAAGIQAGDVITLIAGTPITSIDSYNRAVAQLKAGESVPVRLIRRGAPLFIGLKPE